MCKAPLRKNSPQSLLVFPSMILQRQLPATPNVVVGQSTHSDSLNADLTQRQQRQQHQPQFGRIEQQRMRQRQARDARLTDLNDYQRFLIFIKIMFKIMEQYREDAVLLRANRLVYQCWQSHKESILGNKENDKSSKEPRDSIKLFQEALTAELRGIVNELYWNLTRDYLGYGCD